jgi:hypothetical protein
VAKCKFGEARHSPFPRNDGQPSKTGVKLWFWKFRCKRGMRKWNGNNCGKTEIC